MGQPVNQIFSTTVTAATGTIIVAGLNNSGQRSTSSGLEGWGIRMELMMPAQLTAGGLFSECFWQAGDNGGSSWQTSGYYSRWYYRYAHSQANQYWNTYDTSNSGSYTYGSGIIGRIGGAHTPVGDVNDGVSSWVTDWWWPTGNLPQIYTSYGAYCSVESGTYHTMAGEVGWYTSAGVNTTYMYGFGSNGGSFRLQTSGGSFPVGTTLTLYDYRRANDQ